MKAVRLLLIALALAGLAAAAYALPLADWVTMLAEYARNTGVLGVVLFFLAYVVSTVAFLPGSILTLAAGFVYGPLWGLAIVSPASVAGATCAFLLGRTLLRNWATRVGESARVRAIDAAVSREGFKIVLLLRLSPIIPFNALNYALSLSNVPVRTYLLASFLGMLPGTAMWFYLGSLAPTVSDLSSAGSRGGTTRTLLYIAGLAATVAAAVIAARAARRALHAQLQEPTAP